MLPLQSGPDHVHGHVRGQGRCPESIVSEGVSPDVCWFFDEIAVLGTLLIGNLGPVGHGEKGQ